ncbi:MAG TPA: F0F1 ATP synthase subunit A [Candidatus Paceibacterota bacterium]|nr:F0F1 ATP synthase subunit A [Candidatus Paceibacterota bacterium]
MLEISLKAEQVFRIAGWPVTNAVLLSTLVLLFLAGLAYHLRETIKLVPGALQNLFEMILEGALGLMDSVLGDRRTSERYLPLVFTIFLFVLISNWSGLLPGVSSIVVREGSGSVPLLRSPASDLNFTLALALIAVTFVNVVGAAAVGLRGRLGVFLNFTGPIDFFIGILELVGEFARIISFSFRLFGNVFAGEVLLAIMAFLVPYLVPLPFMFLEIFVGFIQAFIFGMLTLVFVAMAITPHDAGHDAKVATH